MVERTGREDVNNHWQYAIKIMDGAFSRAEMEDSWSGRAVGYEAVERSAGVAGVTLGLIALAEVVCAGTYGNVGCALNR